MKHWKSPRRLFALVAGRRARGSLALPDAWYAALANRRSNPPNAIFAPVWTVLYVLIAIAAWRVTACRGPQGAITCGSCNSPATRSGRRCSSARTASTSRSRHRAARRARRRDDRAVLPPRPYRRLVLVPYFAWIAFATVLTAAIWRLNGAELKRALRSPARLHAPISATSRCRREFVDGASSLVARRLFACAAASCANPRRAVEPRGPFFR